MSRNIDHLIVHCTATPPSLDADAAWVDRVHKKRGWTGNGYHVVIPRDGRDQWHRDGFPCRPLNRPGAHVGGCGPGWNARSIGVSLAGGVDQEGKPEDNFTDAQRTTLLRVISELRETFSIPEQNVIGHRDLIKATGASPKACPCFSVQSMLSEVKVLPGLTVPVTPTKAPDKGFFGGLIERVQDAVKDQIEAEAKRFGINFNWADTPAYDAHRPQGSPEMDLARTWTVKPGETLWRISHTTGVPLATLRSLNEGIDEGALEVGQEVRLG